MVSDGKKKLIKKVYRTSDIVHTVNDALVSFHGQTREFALQFKRPTEYETCKAIHDYVVQHIRYIEDGGEFQYVKTPARLLVDKFGDCKSISIFCASCLCSLGIPCKLRFVSFGSKDVKHVYVVTQSGINIDPVEALCNNKEFNQVTPFTHKIDMKANYGLAILSGIGSADPYKAFLGESNFVDNTLATNYLYSCIDLQFSVLSVAPNNIEAMNLCDIYIAAFTLNAEATGYANMQERAANILQYLSNQGYFSSKTISDEVRETNIMRFTSLALDMLSSDAHFDYKGIWYQWYKNSVAAFDYNQITPTERKKVLSYGSTDSVGYTKNKLADDIKQSGHAVLYHFCSDKLTNEIARKKPIFKAKRAMQTNALQNMGSSLTSFFTPETTQNYAKSGCLQKIGKLPDDYVKGEITKSKVGWIPLVIAIISIVVAILEFCKGLNAKKAVEIESSLASYKSGVAAPTESDLSGLSLNDTGSSSKASMWLLGGAAALLLLPKFLKK